MTKDFPRSKDEIVSKIFEAGVVGAGGAGFPTHIKAKSAADMVIANGCECEPLLRSDKYVLKSAVDDVVDGLLIMMLATGAGKGYVAVREGVSDIVASLRSKVMGVAGVEVITVADSYPAGDEHVLVYEATGRVVPQGGIPIDVGVVVSNVNTLLNIKRAIDGRPVTSRVVSLCGDIANPCIADVPIGTTVLDALRLTGNEAGIEDKGILLSGVMMGEYCDDPLRPVDKRTAAIVVLPRDNEVVVRKSLPLDVIIKRAASVCCQCTFCTELCPRHLMGHAIEPHRVMRAISWGRSWVPDLRGALFCSGCGLCGVYVCPMLLSPDRISFMVRAEMARRQVRMEGEAAARVTPLRSGRLVPHARIVERTGLAPYEKELEFIGSIESDVVRIPLAQHTGAPAKAVVREGERVEMGKVVGDAEPDAISARVHATIDGVVVSVNHQVVIEKR